MGSLSSQTRELGQRRGARPAQQRMYDTASPARPRGPLSPQVLTASYWAKIIQQIVPDLLVAADGTTSSAERGEERPPASKTASVSRLARQGRLKTVLELEGTRVLISVPFAGL